MRELLRFRHSRYAAAWNSCVLLLVLLAPATSPATGGVEPGTATESQAVLGLTFRGAHRAYPAGSFASPWIINDIISRQEVVIYYDRDRALARAYIRMVLGEPILFAERPRGTIGEDLTTMTRWDLDSGKAVSGNLAGMQLIPLSLAETTYAEWNRLHPDSSLFSAQP